MQYGKHWRPHREILTRENSSPYCQTAGNCCWCCCYADILCYVLGFLILCLAKVEWKVNGSPKLTKRSIAQRKVKIRVRAALNLSCTVGAKALHKQQSSDPSKPTTVSYLPPWRTELTLLRGVAPCVRRRPPRCWLWVFRRARRGQHWFCLE